MTILLYNRLNAWFSCLPKTYRAVYMLILLQFIFASLFGLFNLLFFHYHGIWYFHVNNLAYIPLALLVNITAVYALRHKLPFAFTAWACSTYFFAYIAIGLSITAIQFTPFSYIDKHLLAVDQSVGFSSVKALAFAHTNKLLANIMILCYDSITMQLILIPLVLSLANQRRPFLVFVAANLLCVTLAAVIYYFWPTVAPAHLIHSQFFTAAEHNTFIKFYDVHHDINISNISGGIIAFPSMHVVWACLLIHAYRHITYLRVPLTIINIIAIAATVLLGWHYLVDLLGGMILAALVLCFVESWFKVSRNR